MTGSAKVGLSRWASPGVDSSGMDGTIAEWGENGSAGWIVDCLEGEAAR